METGFFFDFFPPLCRGVFEALILVLRSVMIRSGIVMQPLRNMTPAVTTKGVTPLAYKDMLNPITSITTTNSKVFLRM